MKPIEIKDTENIKHIIVRVEVKNNRTHIISAFGAWENIALLLEAVGVSIAKCLKEGMSKDKIYKGVTNYIMKILDAYKITNLKNKLKEGE